jgi:YVTN family beta-propeller protein
MNSKKQWMRGLMLASVGVAALSGMTDQWTGSARVAKAQTNAPSPTKSSPIAITSDNQFVWSVNPDNNSVSVFNVANGLNQKAAEIPVGGEPWNVAITPNNAKVYVTNMATGTVSVINAATWQVLKTIEVGTEPFGCALTPGGERLYVANQSSDDVSVIDTKNDQVIRTIKGVGSKPHGVAITADGNKVYVTQFLALKPANDPRPLTQSEGADNGREGRVTVIDSQTNSVIKTVVLNPVANVGNAFLSIGNTLARRPLIQQASQPQPGQPAVPEISGAFPNLLESVAIRGNIAYIPNTCSSPNGPFRFNVNVQSCLSSINTVQDAEAFPTLNMNVGVNFEPVGKKLFNTNPFAVAFKRSSAEGFAVLAATNRVLRVTLNGQGVPTINPPLNANDAGDIIRIELKDPTEILQPDPNDTIGGKNPRGIVLNSTDTRAYVMDFLSRDVAVVDISGTDPTKYKTLVRIPSAALPAAGSQAAIVQRGKQLFNSAIGPEGALDNSKRPAGRLSDTGWGSCYSCHPQGLTDSVTWMFADGPRQAISMESTFEFRAAVIQNGAPALPASHQRALNWSAVRDEVQDFTRNVRAVSGGGGLILGIAEGAAGLGAVPDLVPVANSFRSADLDAIATYLALGVRAPIAPGGSNGNKYGHLKQGRELFEAAGCQNCHGGRNWTISELDFTPPPAASQIVDAQLVDFLCRVGTFDQNLFTDGVSNEIRANNNANVQARGILGFNVPSLISVFASAPYLHSGAAPTLEAVLENVTHRRIGRPDGQDILIKSQDRANLVEFLKTIDRRTEPFLNVNPPLNACGPQP